MNLREAAQQALEALELHLQWHESGCVYLEPAVTTLRAALAEPVQEPATDWEAVAADQAMTIALMKAEPVQEPVAWMVYTLDGKSVCVTDNPADFTDEHRVLPLYTAPPQPAEPVQEPVAWYLPSPDGDDSIFRDHRTVVACTGNKWEGFQPLYTAPPQRKPLTDADIEAVSDSLPIDDMSMPTTWHLRLARAIERAHGIGGEE